MVLQRDLNGLATLIEWFCNTDCLNGFATRIQSSKYNVHTICMHTSSIDPLPGPSYIHWYTGAEVALACSHT